MKRIKGKLWNDKIVRSSVYLCESIKLEFEPLRGGRMGATMPRVWRSGNGESLNV